MSLVFLNGKFLNAEKASVPVDNRSFRYGDGFFETIKYIDGKIPLWEYHRDRLFSSLEKLSFKAPSFFTGDYVLHYIQELVNRNQHRNLARVRVTIYRGEGGIYDPINHHPNILIQSWPLSPENNKLNENGLVLGIFHGGFKAADAWANLKSNNYLLYVLAAMEAKEKHWNDALVFNHRHTFADSTIANIWIIRDGMIITPPLTDGAVAGTMRSYLLENLGKAEFKVEERSVEPGDVLQADELFLSNAIYGIKWVARCENKTFGNTLIQSIHSCLVKPLWEPTI